MNAKLKFKTFSYSNVLKENQIQQNLVIPIQN